MFKKHGPGCPCCACSCYLDLTVSTFVADAETWTRNTFPLNAVTTSSDARLRSSILYSGWQTLKASIVHTAGSEWVQIGFTSGKTDPKYTITGVNQGTKTFTVAEDLSLSLAAGMRLHVSDSTGNDGIYTVVSATYVTATDIVVAETIPDATVDGGIYRYDLNRVYARVRAITATKTLELEWRETVAGVDSLIASQSFTTGLSVTNLTTLWWLIYDPDYGTITGLVLWGSSNYRNLRQTTTATTGILYGYVGTETITGTTTISAAATRHCYAPEFNYGAGKGMTDRAPHEWELALSGVALGGQVQVCCKVPLMPGPCTPYLGYFDWWNELNSVHVPNSEPGSGGNPQWLLRDSYTWTDANLQCNGPGTAYTYVSLEWRVAAAWVESTSTLIATCNAYNPTGQTMNPAYVGKPVLVLQVSLVITHGPFGGGANSILTATWAAIVQDDWDSAFPDTEYYTGDEHVMTPDLFPAVCSFDWRTVQQKKLTFICSSSPGIDFNGSELYISAVP